MAQDKSPTVPLPPALIKAALPVAADIMKHVAAIEKLVPKLEHEMIKATKAGAIPLARAYVVFHRLRECLCSEEKNRFKPIAKMFEDYKTRVVPAMFEQSGVENVPLTEGYRVQIGNTVRATVIKDLRDNAYNWMRENYPDIVTETINSSTLSALARTMREDNKELPAELFTVADIPIASVVKT